MNLSDNALLKAIEAALGLTNLSYVEKITRGVLSNNNVITDGYQKFFVKEWRIAKTERLRQVLAAERHFSDNAVPVILPLPSGGNDNFLFLGGKHYSLYPYVSASHIEREDLDNEPLTSMARMLARIHRAGKDTTLEIQKLSWPRRDRAIKILESAQQIIDSAPEKSTFDNMAAEYISRKLRLIENAAHDQGGTGLAWDTLIHGDYHESNVFFIDGEMSHVFDFEKTELAPRALELVRCVRHTFLNGDYSERNLERARKFILSYADEFPISADEVRHGIYAWFNRGIYTTWIIEEHYLNSNNRPDVFLENDLAALRFESDHIDELADALSSNLS